MKSFHWRDVSMSDFVFLGLTEFFQPRTAVLDEAETASERQTLEKSQSLLLSLRFRRGGFTITGRYSVHLPQTASPP